ncbi:RNA/RNP complex-1-interacting phosphatase [Rhynchospora pubera]|uniref:RNA/RNP complex-1-interacting phosphatase n=1 Tax=Rhynchospora pubera TaxID=906938 RepID=A0AAV8DDW9_9POAL|nr:RNA/RNP complex-1-interacting phosphatase [Rhynchospora pubera]
MASILGNITKTTPHQTISASSRPRRSQVCLCCLPNEPNKTPLAAVVKLCREVVERGKGLRENLSPKQKGDWKDLVLMSLSFAVYIYVSQQIVCTYCAWISMINHT